MENSELLEGRQAYLIATIDEKIATMQAEIDALKAQNRAAEADAYEARMVLRKAAKKLKELGVDFL